MLGKSEASDDNAIISNAEIELKSIEIEARLNVLTASKLTEEERKAIIAEREKETKFFNGIQELNALNDQYNALEDGVRGKRNLSGRTLWRSLIEKSWALGVHVTPFKNRQTRVTLWDGNKRLTKE